MKVQLSELRDSWPAWLGVSLGILVTNTAIALGALVLASGLAAITEGDLAEQDSTAYVFNSIFNIVICAVIGAAVIGAATSLVVDSRRGSLARLGLAGATPAQVRGAVLWQLGVVSLACTVIASIIAALTLRPALAALAGDRGEGVVPVEPVYAWWTIPGAALLCLGIALMGGRRAAKHASDVPAVEALRQASSPDSDRMSVARWVKAGLCAVIIVALYVLVPMVTAVRTKETISNLVIMSMVALVITGSLLSQLAPLLVGPLTRAWTVLVPRVDPSWTLARAGVLAKSARLSKSVVPVMLAIGLLFGMQIAGDVFTVLARDIFKIELEQAGLSTFLILLGAPLAVSLSGGVGVLIMMSKQRDAELALSGVAGATPAQRVAMPIMEALVITITGALLALIMTGTMLGLLIFGLTKINSWPGADPSWATFGAAFGVTFLIVCAATLLPTLRALRLPEPKVIARLVAE